MLVFVFDFDDTIVDSTPKIHYEAYKQFCELTNKKYLSLKEYYCELFNKTYVEFLKDMNLTDEEYKLEYQNWKKYTSTHHPIPFNKILSLLEYINLKGHKLVICSQSDRKTIENFFTKTFVKVDLIIAGDRIHPERNKPYNYPINLIKKQFNVDNSQIIVVDDMKPGLLMAKNNDVKSIGVLYSGYHDMLRNEIYELSTVVAETIEDLISYIKLLV